jgi:hypothetical protein
VSSRRLHEHVAISLAHAALIRDARSISKVLHPAGGSKEESNDDSLCLYQCDFLFSLSFEDYYIPQRGY